MLALFKGRKSVGREISMKHKAVICAQGGQY
jgi:hypothetical protein